MALIWQASPGCDSAALPRVEYEGNSWVGFMTLMVVVLMTIAKDFNILSFTPVNMLIIFMIMIIPPIINYD